MSERLKGTIGRVGAVVFLAFVVLWATAHAQQVGPAPGSGGGALTAPPSTPSRTTYSASTTGLATAATATDVFTLTGSATKTVRVRKVAISCITAAGGVQSALFILRSTANTVGTSTDEAEVANDDLNAPATATALSYTANPTLGTSVGTIRATKYACNSSSGNAVNQTALDFGTADQQYPTLRGTTDVFAVNLNATTLSSPSVDLYVEWTEE